jgi:curli production assembly/transport component CsgE
VKNVSFRILDSHTPTNLLVTVFLLSAGGFANSQPTTPPQRERAPNTESVKPEVPLDRPLSRDTEGGVVTNQTVTVAGQDFYQYFVTAWRDKESSDHYSLAIKERPSARFGSEVSIEFAQRRIYRTYLPPARASIKPISEEAAESAYRSVVEADLQNRLIQDPDLAPDEI